VIVSLDGDFLGAPGVRYAHDFVGARRGSDAKPDPGRLYVVECTPTLTGSFADHRYAVRFGEIEPIARALAQALGVAGAGAGAGAAGGAPDAQLLPGDALAACARDLKQNAGRALVLVGDSQPPVVHAIAHAINETLGNVGHTVSYTAPILARSDSQGESLRSLTEDMAAGLVDTLIMIGGNPVYNAPADRLFGTHLAKVAMSVHLSLYDDETSALCDWQIPQAHFLESWSDARAFDGTAAIQQPLIAPLYGGKSAHELLALLLGQAATNDYQTVRDFWAKNRAPAAVDAFWNEALLRGVIDGSQLPVRAVACRSDFWHAQTAPGAASAPAAASDPAALDLIFAPDPTVWDGRFANNAWLQELPKPLTKLTWDNAALMGPGSPRASASPTAIKSNCACRMPRCSRRSGSFPASPTDRHGDARLRAHARRAHRQWRRLRCLRAAPVGRSLARAGTANPQDRRETRARDHAAPFFDGRPPARAHDDARRLPPRSCACDRR
jgi:hypothetical protein